jgi:hypothetical protein
MKSLTSRLLAFGAARLPQLHELTQERVPLLEVRVQGVARDVAIEHLGFLDAAVLRGIGVAVLAREDRGAHARAIGQPGLRLFRAPQPGKRLVEVTQGEQNAALVDSPYAGPSRWTS